MGRKHSVLRGSCPVAVRAEPLFISAPADGSHERIVTDTAWKASYVGKVVRPTSSMARPYDNRAGESFLTEPASFSDWPNAVVCDFTGRSIGSLTMCLRS